MCTGGLVGQSIWLLVPCWMFLQSLIQGIGLLLLYHWLPTSSYKALSFRLSFFSKCIGEWQEEELFQIKPLDMFTSIHFLTSVSSEYDMDYIWPISGFLSCIKGIAWSTYQKVIGLSASLLVKKGNKSCYWLSTRSLVFKRSIISCVTASMYIAIFGDFLKCWKAVWETTAIRFF